MRYDLKLIAKEYEHGWSLWIQRDNQKFMLGSAIKTEVELHELIDGIKLEQKERYVPKEDIKELKSKIKELEKVKQLYDDLRNNIAQLNGQIRADSEFL